MPENEIVSGEDTCQDHPAEPNRGTRGGGDVKDLVAGRRAIVTGAASGIGFAVARRLLREGVSVLAVDVNAAGLDAIAAHGP
jgi:hypothetical protein